MLKHVAMTHKYQRFTTHNAFSSSSITSRKITTLTHEAWNNSVESTAFEMQRFSQPEKIPNQNDDKKIEVSFKNASHHQAFPLHQ
jgi:hypothetical protein